MTVSSMGSFDFTEGAVCFKEYSVQRKRFGNFQVLLRSQATPIQPDVQAEVLDKLHRKLMGIIKAMHYTPFIPAILMRFQELVQIRPHTAIVQKERQGCVGRCAEALGF